MSFLSGIVETVAGTISGIGTVSSVAVGMVAVVFIFLISQLFLFGPPVLIIWGFVKIKGLLESSGIIPTGKRISREIFN